MTELPRPSRDRCSRERTALPVRSSAAVLRRRRASRTSAISAFWPCSPSSACSAPALAVSLGAPLPPLRRYHPARRPPPKSTTRSAARQSSTSLTFRRMPVRLPPHLAQALLRTDFTGTARPPLRRAQATHQRRGRSASSLAMINGIPAARPHQRAHRRDLSHARRRLDALRLRRHPRAVL